MTDLSAAVSSSLVARGVTAQVKVFAPFVQLSRKVRRANGVVEDLRSSFRFDGDAVLLRGLTEAVDSLLGQVNQAEHTGSVAL